MKAFLSWQLKSLIFFAVLIAIQTFTGQKADSVSFQDIIKFGLIVSFSLGLFLFLIEKYGVPWFMKRTSRKIVKIFDAQEINKGELKCMIDDTEMFITQNFSISLITQSAEYVTFLIPKQEIDNRNVKAKYKKISKRIGEVDCYQVWQTNSMGIKIAKKRIHKILQS